MVIAGTVQGGAIRAKYVTIVRSFARSIEGELKGGPNRKGTVLSSTALVLDIS